MANVLPTLRGSSKQVLYPFTRTVSFQTKVNTFINATEQRWPQRPPLYSFELSMNALLAGDRDAWTTFFATQKGRFNQDLQLTLGSTTYSNLALESDSFAILNARPLEYDFTIALRQMQNLSWTPPSSPPSTFPALSAGVVCEMPFRGTENFWTSVIDQPAGQRYGWGWYAQGLTGFPSNSQRTWTLQYPVLSDADLATLEGFFVAQQGRFRSFTFNDPFLGGYAGVRFDMDDLAIRHEDFNRSSVTLMLKRINGG